MERNIDLQSSNIITNDVQGGPCKSSRIRGPTRDSFANEFVGNQWKVSRTLPVANLKESRELEEPKCTTLNEVILDAFNKSA